LLYMWIVSVVLAVAFAVRFRNGLKEHRRIEPIRREVQGHPVTFRTSVVVTIRTPSGESSTLRGPLNLIIRGGFLEISNALRPVAVLFGQEYHFRATDLRIETYRDLTYRDQRERIRITDTSHGTDASLSVTALPSLVQTDLGGIWQALVNAGAVPAGQAPQAGTVTKPPPRDLPKLV
jgi:hypothetical protein